MSQAAAPATNSQHEASSSGGTLEVPIPPMRALVLDDNVTFRSTLKNSLEGEGLQVDDVEYTEEAIRLLSVSDYHVVVADIALHSHDMSGDEFILNHKDLMRQAEVIAITGYGTDQVRVQELTDMGVSILTKGNHMDELMRITEQRLRRHRGDIAERIKRAVSEPNGTENNNNGLKLNKAPVGLLRLLEQVLLDWLKSREDPHHKGIIYRGKVYSASELAREIEQGTDVGQAHLKMLVDLFRFSVNLKDG